MHARHVAASPSADFAELLKSVAGNPFPQAAHTFLAVIEMEMQVTCWQA
jgi:hypothetical protein